MSFYKVKLGLNLREKDWQTPIFGKHGSFGNCDYVLGMHKKVT